MIPRTFVGSSYVAELPLTTWTIGGIGNLNVTTKWEKIVASGECPKDNKFDS
jgi:hypothetical protein